MCDDAEFERELRRGFWWSVAIIAVVLAACTAIVLGFPATP